MEKYFVSIKVDEDELAEILKELTDAQERIFQCYSKLKSLGAVEFCKKDAASGN